MPNVRVTCLLCDHPVEVPADGVVLHLDGARDDALHHYGFACPDCGIYVVRRASAAIIDALLHTGEVEISFDAAAPWETEGHSDMVLIESSGPGRPASAEQPPPITEADVLRFRSALDDDEVLASWLAA